MTELVVSADGSKWFVRGAGTDDHLGPSDHEAVLMARILPLLGPTSVFMDIGAHAGGWAVRAALRGAWVVAVEANPSTSEMLRRNVAINGVSDLVSVVTECLWEAEGLAYTFRDAQGFASGGSAGLVQDFGTPVLTGKTTTGDAVLSGLRFPPPTLIKIDVEGAEAEVLYGLERTISSVQPSLYIEIHDHITAEARPRVIEFLETHGYGWVETPEFGAHFFAQPIEEG
jgi:FkbM family methyltransferase